jgi:hypothetical protein
MTEPEPPRPGEELATKSALDHGKVGQEVFVDESEGIARKFTRQRREQSQQLNEHRLLSLW